MKAVMYGGGNIGRGFIGAQLALSGYDVIFIDVAEPVVKSLQENRTYPVRYITTGGYEDIWIPNVNAVNGSDEVAASDVIANCDIMAIAVGARVLKFIVPNIVAALRKRWTTNRAPLNIIICENLMDANKVLECMLKIELTEKERNRFDETVGLVEASIGRMVPVQTDEMKDGEPMRVCVESYSFLPVDKAAFKGEIPQIKNLVPFEPFDFYIKRKLFIHNMGHATCAYLGDLLDLQYISESIDVADIRILVQNAMLESALSLSKRYDVDLSEIQLHIYNLLHRFSNAALKDTCHRVGSDPARKLSVNDRLIGSADLAFSQGIKPAYISLGIAAALKRFIDENKSLEQSSEIACKILAEVSNLDADAELTKMILFYYQMILEGKTIADLRRAADELKNVTLQNVI